MIRFEYKYLAPVELIERLRLEIMPYVNYDEYANASKIGEYTVRSIYFDNDRFQYYNDKVDGLEIRKKVRVRGYGAKDESSIVFLEVKRKKGVYILKSRAPLTFENLEKIFVCKDFERYILNKPIENAVKSAKNFFYYVNVDNLKPVILVVYEREAYQGKFDNSLRITFDKNLRASLSSRLTDLFDELNMRYVMKSYFTVEFKGKTKIPHWFRNIVAKYELKFMALSKYVLSVDAFDFSELKQITRLGL
ncbi:polyphosphate polymerase domain-containing protein [Candidatus Chrysopegis kryptomonas]|uniref:VTC domain-containing protein n=1 Tax=Candidatus Chryseopegocella kryptomonas TaxID=1633643 RepID=A0A0N7MVJ1_9BACT|nr:polyphosphate polymerase domain-containing protein [Candidatus Chrysopegis kryptomonas]CUS95987.1 VTC domain-containing protein [Candidatus Chrysopegis kryptomonas]